MKLSISPNNKTENGARSLKSNTIFLKNGDYSIFPPPFLFLNWEYWEGVRIPFFHGFLI
jgi:hypothetical protein